MRDCSGGEECLRGPACRDGAALVGPRELPTRCRHGICRTDRSGSNERSHCADGIRSRSECWKGGERYRLRSLVECSRYGDGRGNRDGLGRLVERATDRERDASGNALDGIRRRCRCSRRRRSNRVRGATAAAGDRDVHGSSAGDALHRERIRPTRARRLHRCLVGSGRRIADRDLATTAAAAARRRVRDARRRLEHDREREDVRRLAGADEP